MAAYAGDIEVLAGSGAGIEVANVAERHAELVFAQASGDVRVRVRKNIWVDAQCETRFLFHLRGAFGEQVKFALALHVEDEDVGPQGSVNLRGRLAHS